PRIVGCPHQSQFNRPFCQQIYRCKTFGIGSGVSGYLATIGANSADRRVTQILTIIMKRESGKGGDGHGISTRSCTIRPLTGSEDQCLMCLCRGVEPPLVLILKPFHHLCSHLKRSSEVAFL